MVKLLCLYFDVVIFFIQSFKIYSAVMESEVHADEKSHHEVESDESEMDRHVLI